MLKKSSLDSLIPIYKNEQEIAWQVGHYIIKQKLNKWGGRESKYFLYDDVSHYYDQVAFATFNSSFYLDKYLELLMIRDEAS